MPKNMSGLQAAVSKYGLRPAKSGKEKSGLTKAQSNQIKNDKARRRRFDQKAAGTFKPRKRKAKNVRKPSGMD